MINRKRSTKVVPTILKVSLFTALAKYATDSSTHGQRRTSPFTSSATKKMGPLALFSMLLGWHVSPTKAGLFLFAENKIV